jgi:hypothetical protein
MQAEGADLKITANLEPAARKLCWWLEIHNMPWTVLNGILDHSGIPDRHPGPFVHQSFREDVWDAFSKTQVIERQPDILMGTSPLISTLLDAPSRFRGACSTDPGDKIYGLLDLATDNLGIVPDYNKSVREAYMDVVRGQVNATQNLDLITQSLWPLGSGLASHPHADCTIPDLPSWLPNFSATNATRILFAQRSIPAAGAATFPLPVAILSDAGVLTVTGVILDTIVILNPGRETAYPREYYYRRYLRDWLPDHLASNKCAHGSYPAGGNAFEAYWHTLVTDCIVYPSRGSS